MPRIGQPTRKQNGAKQWSEFESGFRRSRRGNLWRTYDGVTVTIFRREGGSFGWCIAVADDDKRFSSFAYETEEEAMESLWREFSF